MTICRPCPGFLKRGSASRRRSRPPLDPAAPARRAARSIAGEAEPREADQHRHSDGLARASRRVAGKLRLGDVAVGAPLRQKFAVAPALNDAAAIEDADFIGLRHG